MTASRSMTACTASSGSSSSSTRRRRRTSARPSSATSPTAGCRTGAARCSTCGRGWSIERLAAAPSTRSPISCRSTSTRAATSSERGATPLAGARPRPPIANTDAAALYRRALEAARRLPDGSGRGEIRGTWTALGDVLEQAGLPRRRPRRVSAGHRPRRRRPGRPGPACSSGEPGPASARAVRGRRCVELTGRRASGRRRRRATTPSSRPGRRRHDAGRHPARARAAAPSAGGRRRGGGGGRAPRRGRRAGQGPDGHQRRAHVPGRARPGRAP